MREMSYCECTAPDARWRDCGGHVEDDVNSRKLNINGSTTTNVCSVVCIFCFLNFAGASFLVTFFRDFWQNPGAVSVERSLALHTPLSMV